MEEGEHSSTDFHPEVWSPRPGAWEVRIGPDDNGWVDNDGRKACVPYPTTEIQEHIRMHEAHHVLLSPLMEQHKDDPDLMTRKMCEEIRVDAYAARHGNPTWLRHDLVPIRTEDADAGTPRNAAFWMLQFATTGFDQEELSLGGFVEVPDCPDGIRSYIDHALKTIDDNDKIAQLAGIAAGIWNNPTDEQVERAIREFEVLFPEDPKFDRHPLGTDGSQIDHGANVDEIKMNTPQQCGHREKITTWYLATDGKWHPNGTPDGHEVGDESRETAISRVAREAAHPSHGPGGDELTSRDRSHRDREGARDARILTTTQALQFQRIAKGHCGIERVVMPANKTFIAVATGGESEKGEEIDNIMRIYTDKRIFKGFRGGGSAVIDVSGSMSWNWPALRQAVKEMPSATIALYGGRRFYNDKTSYPGQDLNGKLIVIAEKGRWADPVTVMSMARFNGGNDVDLEALDWLAKQAWPRVWLSDGAICGGEVEVMAQKLGKEAVNAHVRTFCQRNRIVRTQNVDAAIEFLRRRGAVGIKGIVPWNEQICRTYS